MSDETPKYLYHRVLGMSEVTPDTIKDFVRAILMYGLIPQVPSEYKNLLPKRLQTEPIVWLAEGIYQGFEKGRILQIDTEKIADDKLFCIDAFVKGWWIYEGLIPPEAIEVLDEIL
jgi:hypothetical protein